MSEPRVPIPRDELEALCRRWKVRRLSLFGSVLRDDFGPDSDIDVLVEFEPDARIGFFGLARMQRELEALFGGRSVDLLTPGFLSPYIKDRVLQSASLQYAA